MTPASQKEMPQNPALSVATVSGLANVAFIYKNKTGK